MGFLDELVKGTATMAGGFHSAKMMDKLGPDWESVLAQQEFQRQRQQEVAGQENTKFGQQQEQALVDRLAMASLGLPEGQDLSSFFAAEGVADPGRQEYLGARAGGESAQTRSALATQKAVTDIYKGDRKHDQNLERDEAKAGDREELARIKSKLEADQPLTRYEQGRLEVLNKAVGVAEIRANRAGGGSGGLWGDKGKPFKLSNNAIDPETGKSATLWQNPDGTREYILSGQTAGTRSKDEARAGAMAAYENLIAKFKSAGELPSYGKEGPNILQGFGNRLRGKKEEMLAEYAGQSPDLLDYTQGVAGFVPLMARALGHVGVLTEIDVQRTERLFPFRGMHDAEFESRDTLIRDIMAGRTPFSFGEGAGSGAKVLGYMDADGQFYPGATGPPSGGQQAPAAAPVQPPAPGGGGGEPTVTFQGQEVPLSSLPPDMQAIAKQAMGLP